MNNKFSGYLGVVALLIGLIFTGTFGYRTIEGWSFLNSLYMTVITLTTVGYSEIAPLSDAGKYFNMGLILSGVTTMTYAGSVIVSNITSIDFDKRRKKKMQKRIDQLKKHTVICGFGRMGEVICDELHQNQIDFVVIEKRPELVKRLNEKGYLYIDGDAAHDDELVASGVERARVLVSAIDNDSDGLYIALAGRTMNKDLYITVRANDLKARSRILRAGADRVILPHVMSGKKVAECVINPAVEDFFDLSGGGSRGEDKLQLADLFVTKKSMVFNKSIKDMGDDLKDLIIVGIKDDKNEFQFKPSSDYLFQDGDCIITMGSTSNYKLAQTKLGLSSSPC